MSLAGRHDSSASRVRRFKVTQDRPGRDLLVVRGFVDGRASTQPGDLGTLRFRRPASTGLLGEDRDPSDGFHLICRYPNDPILAHLGIEAVGSGGTGG